MFGKQVHYCPNCGRLIYDSLIVGRGDDRLFCGLECGKDWMKKWTASQLERDAPPPGWSQMQAHDPDRFFFFAFEEIGNMLLEYNMGEVQGTPLHHKLAEYVADWVKSAAKLAKDT